MWGAAAKMQRRRTCLLEYTQRICWQQGQHGSPLARNQPESRGKTRTQEQWLAFLFLLLSCCQHARRSNSVRQPQQSKSGGCSSCSRLWPKQPIRTVTHLRRVYAGFRLDRGEPFCCLAAPGWASLRRADTKSLQAMLRRALPSACMSATLLRALPIGSRRAHRCSTVIRQ